MYKEFYCSKLHKQSRDSLPNEPMDMKSPFYNFDFILETRYAIEHQFPETKYFAIMNLIFKF